MSYIYKDNATSLNSNKDLSQASSTEEFFNILLISLYYSVVGAGVILCSKVTYIILRHPKLKTRPNILLINLLVSDILLLLCFINAKGRSGESECRVITFLAYLFGIASAYSLSTISFDRYIAIGHPYLYERKMGKKYFIFIISVPWMVAIFLTSPILSKEISILFKPETFCDLKWSGVNKPYAILAVTIGIGVPFAMLLVTNVKVYKIAKSQMRKIHRDHFKTRKPTSETEPSEIVSAKSDPSLAVDILREALSTTQNIKKGDVIMTAVSTDIHTNHTKDYPMQSMTEMSTKKNIRKSNQMEHSGQASRSVINISNTCQVIHSSQGTSYAEASYNKNLYITIVCSTYLLILGFMCCWFPFVLYRAFTIFVKIRTNYQVANYLKFVTISTGIVDPVIILLSRKEIRKASIQQVQSCFSKLLRRIKRSPNTASKNSVESMNVKKISHHNHSQLGDMA